MERFTDRIDASTKISLYEYNLIRNPKTDKVVYCTNCYELDTSWGDLMEDSVKPIVKTTHINLDDVREALEDVDEGYFDFIGSSREEDLSDLDNNYLSHHIFSLNQWNGYFEMY